MIFQVANSSQIEDLCISPAWFLEKKTKIRIIPDPTFEGPNRRTRKERRLLVDANTEWKRFTSKS